MININQVIMLVEKLHWSYKSVTSQIKDIGSELLPKGKNERLLLLGLMVFYFSYSLYYGMETALIAHRSKWYDLYFSFDNVVSFYRGYSNTERHPFLQIFSYPFVYLGDAISKYIGLGWRVVYFVFFSSLCVSLSVMYVYRYLIRIINLSRVESISITIFYALFSTNLILAFTTESFTVSLFLLSFAILYFSKKIKEGNTNQLFSPFLFVFVLGGVTITNAVKGLIPMLFARGTLTKRIMKIGLVGGVFIAVWYLSGYNIRSIIFNNEHFLDTSGYSYWDKVISFFFGMPILLSHLCIANAPHVDYVDLMIFYVPYEMFWQYAFIFVVLILVLVSIPLNYKKGLFQYLMLLFLTDVFIHVVFGLGLYEGMLYGGHWVYTIPLFVGWLFKSVGDKQKKVLMALLGCLIVVLAINNLVRMMEFTSLVLEYFPKSDSLLN